MKTLIKTNKVINFDCSGLWSIYRFAKYNMEWKANDLIKKLEEIYPYRHNPDYSKKIKFIREHNINEGVNVYIPINSVILPYYMVDQVPSVLRERIRPERNVKFNIKNFSLFNIYDVVNDPEGEFGSIHFGVSLEPKRKGNYGIGSLWIGLENKLFRRFPSLPWFGAIVFDLAKEEAELEELIRSLEPFEGKSYSKLPDNILAIIHGIERYLTTTINLIYVLYNNNFDGDDIISWLFKNYSDVLKNLGCRFEDVLSKLRAFSLLLS